MRIIVLVFLAFCLNISAPAQDTNIAPASSFSGTAPTPSNPAADLPAWKLVFDDEFDQPGLPDPAKWGYEVGRSPRQSPG
jgi:hypothetical protein